MITWLQSLADVPAKWRRRPLAERRLLLEAFCLLGLARLTILAVPFKWFALTLGQTANPSPIAASASQLSCAKSVGQAVRSAARYTPWQSVCLPQAVAAQWMLKRRRISATLFLGVAKDQTQPQTLAAHAWLRCGDAIITGAEDHHLFTVVATFC
jgi:hypothetical protein